MLEQGLQLVSFTWSHFLAPKVGEGQIFGPLLHLGIQQVLGMSFLSLREALGIHCTLLKVSPPIGLISPLPFLFFFSSFLSLFLIFFKGIKANIVP